MTSKSSTAPPSADHGATSADSHTSKPGPVRSSFFVGDMIDAPLGPGDAVGWYLIDGAYRLVDPFLDWPEYFYDADQPSSVPTDTDDTPDPVASIDPSTIRVAGVARLKAGRGGKITTSGLYQLQGVINDIRTSTDLQELTEKARAIVVEHGRESDEYGAHKVAMPGFLPSVTVPEGTPIAKLPPAGNHSGLYGYDLDEPRPVDIDRMREELRNAPGIVSFGVSVGADGMWCVASGPIAETDAEHKAHWLAISKQLPDAAKATSSDLSKNFCRARVLAHDPHAWIAEGPVTPLPGATAEELDKGRRKSERKAEREARDKTADPDNFDPLTEHETKLLGGLEVPPDYNGWLSWLATLKAAGFDIDAVEAWASKGPNYQAGEVADKWDKLPSDFPPDARQRYRRAVGGTLTLLARPCRDNTTDTANFHRLVHFNARRLVVALPEPTDPSESLSDIYGVDSRGMLSSAQFAASVLRTGREYLSLCFGLMERSEFAACTNHARKMRDVGAPERLRQVAAGALAEQREHDAIPESLVVKSKSDIDASLGVIGSPSGVLNLRTGKILSPSEAREHFVLSSTGVNYDPKARHPKVDEILPHPAKLTEGSVELYRAMVIAFGMLNRPQREFLWEICSRGSGKTSFTNCLRQGLGDQYVRAVRREALQVSKFGNGASSHNGDLRHFKAPARFVFVSEMRGNLDGDLLKRLTGGDTVEMRRIHREDESFSPMATLWIQGNPRDSRDAPSLGIDDEDSEDTLAILDRAKMLARPTIPASEQEADVVLLSTPEFKAAALARIVDYTMIYGGLTFPKTIESLGHLLGEQKERETPAWKREWLPHVLAPLGEGENVKAVNNKEIYADLEGWWELNGDGGRVPSPQSVGKAVSEHYLQPLGLKPQQTKVPDSKGLELRWVKAYTYPGFKLLD